jgi:hypothetical protein
MNVLFEEFPNPSNNKNLEPLRVNRSRNRALLPPLSKLGETGLSDAAVSAGDGYGLLRRGVTLF